MTIDTATALKAAKTWRTLAALEPTIRAYLEPRRGHSEVHMPAQSRPPIDIVTSDILHDLDEIAGWYCIELTMETKDVKRIPDTIAGKLLLIAERHGHWTASGDRSGLEYCDHAHELMGQVERLIVQPLPPQFMGPCLAECGGELWMKSGNGAASCDECGSMADLGSVKVQLARAFKIKVMTRTELVTALRLVGAKATRGTVDSWIARGRLVPVIREPQMFRFAEAVELAGIEVAA